MAQVVLGSARRILDGELPGDMTHPSTHSDMQSSNHMTMLYYTVLASLDHHRPISNARSIAAHVLADDAPRASAEEADMARRILDGETLDAGANNANWCGMSHVAGQRASQPDAEAARRILGVPHIISLTHPPTHSFSCLLAFVVVDNVIADAVASVHVHLSSHADGEGPPMTEDELRLKKILDGELDD